MRKCFDTDRRIRLGIWGLGRGSSFIKAAAAVNIDIVAGCDFSETLRDKFRRNCPDAFVTADEQEFLKFRDMDAVLIATYFDRHAEHTVRALEAGFHVMCEVTSFFTPAEGVRVLEAVEKSGKVYNLLENYPFTKENLYLRKLWRDGFFGEFQYGEFEYLHECRKLCYAYNAPGEPPVEPGYAAHSWRSWLDFHYYNTHSLGPLMQITGLRPVEITALPETVALPGYLPGSGMARPCPSLIRMSNGGVMRNLCGATTGDYHMGKRIWGTRASAESLTGKLQIRVGAAGSGLRLPVEPEWPKLAELADSTGHGGGDFWELYYFAREILTGEPAPWDICAACDVTLAGIMAVRSQAAGGRPMEIPDFRDPAVRDRYRHDDGAQTRPFDPEKIFPDGHDRAKTSRFDALMLQLLRQSAQLREACDGAAVYAQVRDPAEKLRILERLSQSMAAVTQLAAAREEARGLIAAYPDCPAAEALRGALTLTDAEFRNGEEALRAQLARTRETLLSE